MSNQPNPVTNIHTQVFEIQEPRLFGLLGQRTTHCVYLSKKVAGRIVRGFGRASTHDEAWTKAYHALSFNASRSPRVPENGQILAH